MNIVPYRAKLPDLPLPEKKEEEKKDGEKA